jgi:hypothetical protein
MMMRMVVVLMESSFGVQNVRWQIGCQGVHER